jgi:hypothetical protein
MIRLAHRMRNDVSIPPEDSDALDAPLGGETTHKDVSGKPVPPPDDLIADVELYDHPDFLPSGAGNFWLLGIIGFALIGVVLLVWWMVNGLMK